MLDHSATQSLKGVACWQYKSEEPAITLHVAQREFTTMMKSGQLSRSLEECWLLCGFFFWFFFFQILLVAGQGKVTELQIDSSVSLVNGKS